MSNKTQNFFKGVRLKVSKHSPEILTGIGIAGMITTTVLAVKATPKAIRLIEEAKENEGLNKNEKLPVKTVVKVTWKSYIPAAVTAGLSIACLVSSSSIHTRRNAALAAAYKISETALSEYKEKVIETIGEKKEKNIRQKINEDKVKSNPVSSNNVLITEKGNTLCYEAISGRYFKSDIDKIKSAVNELNRRMLSEMYISLNEYYSEIGLDPTKVGSELGWNVEWGLIELDFGSLIADDGTPCIVVDYNYAPRYGYSNLV